MSENAPFSKTKSQLRAERRAVQEAQRAAKASAKPSANQQRPPQQQTRSADSGTSQQPQQAMCLETEGNLKMTDIDLSTRAIAEAAMNKLQTMARGGCGPVVVMIYTFSATVEKTLIDAHHEGVPLDVVVVDSPPAKEGYGSVRRLSAAGLKCQYLFLTGVSAVLRRVNLVLLGADGLLANGNVVAPLGSSQVAMAASVHNVPVLVLCQTSKFREKVSTATLSADWPGMEVVPAQFVTGVVTELRTLPCSAVPAVLRVKHLGGDFS